MTNPCLWCRTPQERGILSLCDHCQADYEERFSAMPLELQQERRGDGPLCRVSLEQATEAYRLNRLRQKKARQP